MAFYDWNHDGKKDFTDDFIEYNIYNESTKIVNLLLIQEVEEYLHLEQFFL